MALPAAVADAVRGAGPDVLLGLRPEALHLSADGPIAATVILVESARRRDARDLPHRERRGGIIVRQGPNAPKPGLGEAVRIVIDPDPNAYHLFDATSGLRLGDGS